MSGKIDRIGPWNGHRVFNRGRSKRWNGAFEGVISIRIWSTGCQIGCKILARGTNGKKTVKVEYKNNCKM